MVMYTRRATMTFTKFWKATVSSVMSDSLSICMEHHGSPISVEKIKVSLKSDKNDGYFAWRPTCTYDYRRRFIIYNNFITRKTKGPSLMELFTATGKLKKFFFYIKTRVIRCVHHGWHGTHRYVIQVLATQMRQHGCIDILHCRNDPCL